MSFVLEKSQSIKLARSSILSEDSKLATEEQGRYDKCVEAVIVV